MGSKKKISIESFKYFEQSENENTTYQNLRDTAKVVLRGKLIALNIHIRKEERPKIKNLCFHLEK